MTDKVQKIREGVARLQLHTQSEVLKQVLDYIDKVQKEPVSDRLAFKAIPRLLEMIEPTDRAKSYTAKLADALEVEGYSTDAKIVRESLKIMNGEKVPMATMDGEPVSEKKCMYSKDDYTDEDRKVLCDGCEEECKYSKSDDFTIALAECIHQAQGRVVDPLVLAETWRDELIKLAKCEEPVSTKDKLLALSDGRLHLEWIDDVKVVEFEECLMQFHEDMNNIPQDTDSLTRLKDTDGVLHSYSKKLMSMAKEEIKAIKFKAGDKIRLINDDGTGIQTIKKVIRDGYLTTEMLRIKLKDENQWVRVDDNFEGRFEEKEIEL